MLGLCAFAHVTVETEHRLGSLCLDALFAGSERVHREEGKIYQEALSKLGHRAWEAVHPLGAGQGGGKGRMLSPCGSPGTVLC